MDDKNRTANKLAAETSPYLLQHSHNPVNWFPWGEEAFERAKREDKPIFLSVGYSTCHWCHVMAHESFENEEVARELNRYFVAVKVDREQRPDVDALYMLYCQRITGAGGWPMSVFMDAKGNPFYAGTYYPTEIFLSLLRAIHLHWQTNRAQLAENCEKAIKMLADTNAGQREKAPVLEAIRQFSQSFDAQYGGFGSAPKFPSPHNLLFLLAVKPEMAEKTLHAMYGGGIFDHIGYGFCRYSTDAKWLVPHFEKMLYDNALLANAYLYAFEKTGQRWYAEIVDKIFIYIANEMTSENGTFYSAQDADSEGREGLYYLFAPEEILQVLGREAGERFCRVFHITEKGHLDGKSIPNRIGEPVGALENEVPAADIKKLYAYRKNRAKLFLDNKIVTSWNALMIAAYAQAYRILGKPEYLAAAEKAFSCLLATRWKANILYTGSTPGFLDDYAFFAYAALCLHQASLKQSYLAVAEEITKQAVQQFYDPQGGFYFSGLHNEKLIINTKNYYDNAMPSGNSVMAYVLSRLEHPLSEEHTRHMNARAHEYPMAFGFYLYSSLPFARVVCVLKNPEDIAALRVPPDTFMLVREKETPEYPILNNKTTYYVCKNGTCLPPVNKL